MAPINRGFLAAGILTVIGTLVFALVYVGNDEGTLSNLGWRMFAAVVIGLVLAQIVSRLTEYFTSTETQARPEIAEAARTGPATTVLSGIALGSRVVGVGDHRHRRSPSALRSHSAAATSSSRSTSSPSPAWACSPRPASSSRRTRSARWPTTPPASPRCRVSSTGEAERIMVSLDAVGNTTKAVTKGFAIGSAVIAAVALFASFIETIGAELNLDAVGNALFHDPLTQINVADPKTFIGLLIGGSIAFMFCVARDPRRRSHRGNVVVQEVRRQFADGKIMSGEKRPDYGPVIDICTTASLRELATPALLAVLTPVIIGFGINYFALGAFLAAVILTGQLMANFLSNSGGAWDNAKKYIEDGHEGGKGSEAHKAAVIGDTVGDPFKDTAGPALNPLIKVMNLVSLLILPAVINLQDNDSARFTIAGGALVILLGAIAFSKRSTGSMTDSPSAPAAAAAPEPQPVS